MSEAPRERVLADDWFRHEAAHLVAALTRFLGPAHVALAEDVAQDALISALQAWRDGVPDHPRAWLQTTARHRAIDHLRRERRIDGGGEEALAARIDTALSADADAANQLAMMFACCHDGLSEETHVTLILRFLCGFSAQEIAAAFLCDADTIARRIHRGREKLRLLSELEAPSDAGEVEARLPSVLRALYLLFNEGFHGSDPEIPVHAALCADAMRLADLLLDSSLTALPEVYALRALFCFHAARAPTRLDASGVFVPLAEQDRTAWLPEVIAEGMAYLAGSAEGERLTRWHLEAGIACEHVTAPSLAATDWARIVSLYDLWVGTEPGAVVSLNRALALAEAQGLPAGRAAFADLPHALLAEYPFYWAAAADLSRRAGEHADAQISYGRAIALSRNRAESESYARRLRVQD